MRSLGIFISTVLLTPIIGSGLFLGIWIYVYFIDAQQAPINTIHIWLSGQGWVLYSSFILFALGPALISAFVFAAKAWENEIVGFVTTVSLLSLLAVVCFLALTILRGIPVPLALENLNMLAFWCGGLVTVGILTGIMLRTIWMSEVLTWGLNIALIVGIGGMIYLSPNILRLPAVF